MTAPAPRQIYVSFTAEVQPATADALISVMAQQANAGIDHVHLMLSSPGGYVMSGFTVYNALRAMPFKLTTYNIASAPSAA